MESMITLAYRARCVRPGIRVVQVVLQRHNGAQHEEGVVTQDGLKPGDFIGCYCGEWKKGEEDHSRSDYSFDVDDEFVVIPPAARRSGGRSLAGCRGRPSKSRYPLTRINEPPPTVC